MGNSYSKYLSVGVNIPTESTLYKDREEQTQALIQTRAREQSTWETMIYTNKINNRNTCCGDSICG
jgi:hypothetical protein